MKKTNYRFSKNFCLAKCHIHHHPESFTKIFYGKCRTGEFKKLEQPVNSKGKDTQSYQQGN
jgi:hypothetical protein